VAAVEAASDADVRDRAQASDEEESILAGAGATIMCARLVPPVGLRKGAGIRLTIDTKKLYFFDAQGDNLRRGGEPVAARRWLTCPEPAPARSDTRL